MAAFLYRLGQTSFHRRRLVLALWLAVLIGLGTLSATFGGQTTDDFAIKGTESSKATALLKERFPSIGADKGSARIAFAASAGHAVAEPAYRKALRAVLAKAAIAPRVATVSDPLSPRQPLVSQDGTIALSQVTFTVKASALTDGDRSALRDSARAAEGSGLAVEFGGDAGTVAPAANEGAAGMVIAVVVLALTFGSLLAAGMNLLTAVIGVGVGSAGITVVSAFVDLNSTAPTVALMLGLAVGIDYALFIISRYRQELLEGGTPQEAAARAVATAGSSVVFAALTVVIALAALSLIGIPFLTGMGLCGAAAVAVAALVALTLVPAITGFAGQRILGRRTRRTVNGVSPETAPPAAGEAGFARRWAATVTRRPALVLLATTGLLLLAALPVTRLDTALPSDGTAATDTTQSKAYKLISEGFGVGFNGPLVIAVDKAGPADVGQAAARAARQIKELRGVVAVGAPQLDPTGDTAVFTVVPAGGPTSHSTAELVNSIRGQEQGSTARLLVGGATAVNIDVTAKLMGALPVYLIVVVGLALLLLAVVFRSVLVPVMATAGFLLTIGSTFGAAVAVFQWGWLSGLTGVDRTAPLVSLLPVLVVGVLFGLAMDYQVFLVSRMREAAGKGEPARSAVRTGFGQSARVVFAAALIMIAVFAGFVATHDQIVKSIGFSLAFGVLVDALIVRMTMVPAAMALLGERAWWLPEGLARVLPTVDVEGEALHKQETGAEPVPVAEPTDGSPAALRP